MRKIEPGVVSFFEVGRPIRPKRSWNRGCGRRRIKCRAPQDGGFETCLKRLVKLVHRFVSITKSYVNQGDVGVD